VDRIGQAASDTVFYTDGKKRLEDLRKANLARLEQPERVRANCILIYLIDKVTREELPEAIKKAKQEQMSKIIQRLKAGEDFTKLAKEFSEEVDVAKTGGEYVVGREATIAPELKFALFSLPTNQVSDIITTRFGYYVARVSERIAAGKPPLAKAESDIKEHLLALEVQRQLPGYFAQLKKEFNVEVSWPGTGK
jgi:parvulin-like peptidyl-prolyl isomerase